MDMGKGVVVSLGSKQDAVDIHNGSGEHASGLDPTRKG